MLEVVMSEREPQSEAKPIRSRVWILLLVAPYIGLCFPQMYTRLTPVLLGFPFFYWYQFGWVLLTSALLALVYLKTKTANQKGR